MSKKTYVAPVKPDVIEPGTFWATVAEIHQSDGHGPGEKQWACEMFMYHDAEFAAREAGETWWQETDQSQDCELTIALEASGGKRELFRMRVGMVIKARLLRKVSSP